MGDKTAERVYKKLSKVSSISSLESIMTILKETLENTIKKATDYDGRLKGKTLWKTGKEWLVLRADTKTYEDYYNRNFFKCCWKCGISNHDGRNCKRIYFNTGLNIFYQTNAEGVNCHSYYAFVLDQYRGMVRREEEGKNLRIMERAMMDNVWYSRRLLEERKLTDENIERIREIIERKYKEEEGKKRRRR